MGKAKDASPQLSGKSPDLEAQRKYVREVAAKGGVSPDLEAQRKYVKEVEAKEADFNLVVADAFVRGMRDIGYKSSAWAMCELIDNAIQAEAMNVHVAFDDKTKPGAIAVIDDGHGMDPAMIRLGVVWGGGHRAGSKTGFGKYGYGLPTASVNLGRAFIVYSRVDGGEWHGVRIDLDDIQEGKLTKGHRIEPPKPEEVDLPAWVDRYMKKSFPGGGLDHGTIVVLEKLDKVRPKRGPGLQNALQEHFGVIYRNFLRSVPIAVNGEPTEPVDPLFVTPGFRYFDIDEDRAEALDPASFQVTDKDTGESLGTIKVRYSSMPATFARVPEDKLKPRGKPKNNPRFNIIDENNGLIIMREGRQIDVIRSSRAHKFNVNNDDRYWGCEIDFPVTLDDEFSITTSKQQVQLSDRIWEALKDNGVFVAIGELRTRYDQATEELKEEINRQKKRAAEEAMARAAELKTKKPEVDEAQQRKEADDEMKREAKRRSDLSGVPVPEVERQLVIEQKDREYITDLEAHPGAPFYRVVPRGGSRVLYINKAHRFYSKLYAASDNDQVRSALEALLWVLGETELDAEKPRRTFYENERYEWSRRLSIVLDLLDQSDGATGPIPEEKPAAKSA